MAFSDDWANAVRAAIGTRSRRALAPKVGVTATYIGDWLLGQVPSEAIVIRFAEATGADEQHLLEAAGYREKFNPDTEFNDFVRELQRDYPDVARSFSLEEIPAANATREQVEALKATIRARCEEKRKKNEPRGGAGAQVGEKGRKGGERGRMGEPLLCAAG